MNTHTGLRIEDTQSGPAPPGTRQQPCARATRHGPRRPTGACPGAPPSPCRGVHFFFPPVPASSFFSQETTFPSITQPLPSRKATRDKPSQFLKVSQTNGCCGWKLHSAISLDFSACGSSIFFPPVSLPIFHLSAEMRQAERPQRTKPMGE